MSESPLRGRHDTNNGVPMADIFPKRAWNPCWQPQNPRDPTNSGQHPLRTDLLTQGSSGNGMKLTAAIAE